MEKVQSILMIVGAITVGLPALLRALHAILLIIPGEQGEKYIEKLLAVSEKMAEMATKFFPLPKK